MSSSAAQKQQDREQAAAQAARLEQFALERDAAEDKRRADAVKANYRGTAAGQAMLASLEALYSDASLRLTPADCEGALAAFDAAMLAEVRAMTASAAAGAPAGAAGCGSGIHMRLDGALDSYRFDGQRWTLDTEKTVITTTVTGTNTAAAPAAMHGSGSGVTVRAGRVVLSAVAPAADDAPRTAQRVSKPAAAKK